MEWNILNLKNYINIKNAKIIKKKKPYILPDTLLEKCNKIKI